MRRTRNRLARRSRGASATWRLRHRWRACEHFVARGRRRALRPSPRNGRRAPRRHDAHPDDPPSGSSAERAAAALAIGQVHGRVLAPTLRALLADRDTVVAANAAYALGLLADSASVEALAHAVGASPRVGRDAAWALGQIGEPARAAIVRGLTPFTSSLSPKGRDVLDVHGENVPASVRGALLLATFNLKPIPVEAVVPWLADHDPVVRWSAAYAIARPYSAAGVRALLPLASDTDAEVRAQVARAFSHRAAGDSIATLVRDPLAKLATDPNSHVRINALRSLATYGSSSASKAIFTAATHDPDANVRVVAAEEMGPVFESNRSAWMTAWKADTGFMYRRSLLASALSQDVVLPATELDEPDSWAHQGDWRLRAAVAEAGGAAPTILRMREVSLPFSRDPDPRVRAVAYAAMAPHADTAEEHPWRREFMEYGLKDEDVIVRATAIGSLEGHASAAEVPLVVESYRRAAADTVNDARLAAVRYFTSAWTRDSAHFADSTIAAIRALPVPPDMLTRSAADSFPLLARWKSAPPPASRPASWYEAIVRTRILPALGGTLPRAEIVTERGTITLELYPVEAPLTVDNFLSLAASHYYDDGSLLSRSPELRGTGRRPLGRRQRRPRVYHPR